MCVYVVGGFPGANVGLGVGTGAGVGAGAGAPVSGAVYTVVVSAAAQVSSHPTGDGGLPGGASAVAYQSIASADGEID